MVFDLDKPSPVYAIWNIFDFKAHIGRIRLKHPSWPGHQLECCLYWQPKARKDLHKAISFFQYSLPPFDVFVTKRRGKRWAL
jgi:hypothetical protein